jgi:hypothetical protein
MGGDHPPDRAPARFRWLGAAPADQRPAKRDGRRIRAARDFATGRSAAGRRWADAQLELLAGDLRRGRPAAPAGAAPSTAARP